MGYRCDQGTPLGLDLRPVLVNRQRLPGDHQQEHRERCDIEDGIDVFLVDNGLEQVEANDR